MNDYLDPSMPTERRVEDLLRRMTIAEKAGLMFHPTTEPVGGDLSDSDALKTAELNVVDRRISHFNVLGGEDSGDVAAWHNRLQEMAADTRLGVPITLSSDPRHGFRSNPFTGQALDSLSRWPETTGIAAIGGSHSAEEYGGVIRQEFLAMGIRVFLGPMADIFSEPRWSRGFGTFGEDPDRVAELTVAFINGLRGGSTLGPESVAAIVKHFPGAGPQLNGDDAHDARYPEQVYPGGMQELHIRPFKKAFAAGVTQVMTYYGKPIGTEWDEVGFAFNTPVVRDILRHRLRFDGIVVTDWNVLEGEPYGDVTFGPNGWGLEHLTPIERARIAIEAGVDQFGGDRNTALIEELVDSGLVPVDRIDQSVRRILREKLQLGIFENRTIDVEQARELCGSPVFFAKGVAAQRASLVLLSEDAGYLGDDDRVYVEGVQDTAGLETTSDPADATAIIVRLEAPYEKGRGAINDVFHGGSLAFPQETIDRLAAYAAHARLYVSVFLERPAILGPIIDLGATVIGEFGANDQVLLDALQGRMSVTGTLPFDIPSSMEAVENSREDVPFDTHTPHYRAGFGLTRGPVAAVPATCG